MPDAKLILVADKDPNARDLIAFFLKKNGYNVEYAADGHAALECAKQRHPALLITAILLPGIDGLSLCRLIRKEPAVNTMGVIICSILAATNRAHEAGADAFLRKPLSEQRLVETVSNVLHHFSDPRSRSMP